MTERATVYASSAAAATSQPLATATALDVLRQGGNAVDAAVSAAAVLSVVEPHMSGIGGDMFALLWSAPQGRLVGLDASGRAGASMTRDALLARGCRTVPARSIEAVTVPGALAGWAALLERHGTFTLARALEPAIATAEDGFEVTPVVAREWAAAAPILRADAGARETFLIGGARPPAAGERFRNADYAATLRAVASEGPAVLYGGALGRRIVERVAALGGFLSRGDLEESRPAWVAPVSVPFHGVRVWELPPAGQGIAALEMLRMLELIDLAAMGHGTAAYLHTLIEAKKLAFADLERYVADRSAMDVSVEHLLSDAFIQERRGRIDPERAADRPPPGPAAEESETVYLTTADGEGTMVSFINSNYHEFGSGIVVPGTGFALQDRGAGFTLQPGLPNTVAPGKRPFHTIIPAFATRPGPDGVEAPWLSFGVMGGSMQPQGQVQVLLDLLLFEMDLQAAVDAARFRHLEGRRVALEPGVGAHVRAALAARGHEIVDERAVAFGGAQAILRLPRGYAAASDPRKDGEAAGF